MLSKLLGIDKIQEHLDEISRTARKVYVPAPKVRTFKAGTSDRLSATWNPAGVSIDAALRSKLRPMRARSRELFYNNEYAKHFYRLLKNNVVGPKGVTLQVKVKDANGSLDRDANKIIETAFTKWSKRGVCDVTGKLSWLDIQKVALENCARDGEVLIRKVSGYENSFGFALQLIEADLLDLNLSGELPGGNMIRMGVEFNKWDRPVAYWILKRHPGDYLYRQGAASSHERIPAEEIIHLHLPEFARQSRGFPWGHAAMSRLKKVDIYEENEIVASGIAASKMGFYELDEDAEDDEFDGDENESGDIELPGHAEGGTIEKLPKGYKFKPWDPQHPSGNYDPSMKRMMRAVSSGLGVNYPSLGNDLSDVNFSSIRHGTQEDRDNYKGLQEWFIEWLCCEVYAAWLPPAMLTRSVKLPFTRLERFLADTWRGRRWGYVNPLQDAAAKDKEIKGGHGTMSSALAEKGIDFEEYLEARQYEKELAAEYDVELPYPVVAPELKN